jgi:hypothetical protein
VSHAPSEASIWALSRISIHPSLPNSAIREMKGVAKMAETYEVQPLRYRTKAQLESPLAILLASVALLA